MMGKDRRMVRISGGCCAYWLWTRIVSVMWSIVRLELRKRESSSGVCGVDAGFLGVWLLGEGIRERSVVVVVVPVVDGVDDWGDGLLLVVGLFLEDILKELLLLLLLI